MGNLTNSGITRFAAVALTALMATSACASAVGKKVEFYRLDGLPVPAATNSGITARSVIIARSADDWQRAWQELYAHRRPAPAMPHIDFKTHMVVVFAWGRQSSGGYSALIESANIVSGELVIGVRLMRPSPACIVTLGLTAPADLVAIPAFDGPVTIAESEEVTECPDSQ